MSEIEALAHRMAWRYKQSSDPHHSDTYTFNRATLLQFAEALVAIEREKVRELVKALRELGEGTTPWREHDPECAEVWQMMARYARETLAKCEQEEGR